MDKATLKQYKKDYNRGWNTSARMTDGALDRADSRGEVTAWFSGYYDHACGRDKWINDEGIHRITGEKVGA